MSPAIAAITAMAPTMATASSRTGLLPPPGVGTTSGVATADGVASADADGGADDGGSDGATGLKSGGSVPGGGVGGIDPLGAAVTGASFTKIVPITRGLPAS